MSKHMRLPNGFGQISKIKKPLRNVTMAKRKGVNDFAIKYIIGHTISDITERVYTERYPEWLRKEINLV